MVKQRIAIRAQLQRHTVNLPDMRWQATVSSPNWALPAKARIVYFIGIFCHPLTLAWFGGSG